MVTSITFETVEAARRLLTAAGYTPVSVGVRKFRTPTGTVQVPVVTGLRGPDNWFPDARDIFVGDQIAPDEGGGGEAEFGILDFVVGDDDEDGGPANLPKMGRYRWKGTEVPSLAK